MNGINAIYIQGYASSITGIINGILVPVLISIAFIVFLWGIYKYFIQGAADPEAHTKGRELIIYGIAGFVVLFSLWAIIQIFMGTLNLGAANSPPFPTIGGSGGNTNTSPTYLSGGSTYNPNIGSNYVVIPAPSNSGGSSAQSQLWTLYNAQQSACAASQSSPQCLQANQAYYQAYYGTGSGAGSSSIPASTSQQANSAYNSYQSCINSPNFGSSSPVCKQYLATYTSSGGTTCGTIITSVCAPGSTCSLGFCKSIPAGSVAQDGVCGGSPSVCMQGLTCDVTAGSPTVGKCEPPKTNSAGNGDACNDSSQCMQNLTCDMDSNSQTYLKCIPNSGGTNTGGTCTPDSSGVCPTGCFPDDNSTTGCIQGVNQLGGNGGAGSACITAADCLAGFTCPSGTCLSTNASTPSTGAVHGCTDSAAQNYNPNASVYDPNQGDQCLYTCTNFEDGSSYLSTDKSCSSGAPTQGN
ncbi:MAG: pilin [Minisyncoccia bacterium]|jgi:hypothetical protein